MNNKGYLVFELLVTIGLVIGLSLLVFTIVSQVADGQKIYYDHYDTLIDDIAITYNLNHDLLTYNLEELNTCSDSTECYEFVYSSFTKKLFVSNDKSRLVYGNMERKASDNENFNVIKIYNNYHSTVAEINDSILNIEIDIHNNNFSKPFLVNVNHFYNNGDISFGIPLLTVNESLDYNIVLGDASAKNPGYSTQNIAGSIIVNGTIDENTLGEQQQIYSYYDGVKNVTVNRKIYVWNDWSTTEPGF